MKALLAAGIVGILLSLGACASAPASDEPELVVDGVEWECRRIKEIGTNLGKKVCGSPEEWAARDKAEKEEADRTSAAIIGRGIGSAPAAGIGN